MGPTLALTGSCSSWCAIAFMVDVTTSNFPIHPSNEHSACSHLDAFTANPYPQSEKGLQILLMWSYSSYTSAGTIIEHATISTNFPALGILYVVVSVVSYFVAFCLVKFYQNFHLPTYGRSRRGQRLCCPEFHSAPEVVPLTLTPKVREGQKKDEDFRAAKAPVLDPPPLWPG
jgi:hypothetical protein